MNKMATRKKTWKSKYYHRHQEANKNQHEVMLTVMRKHFTFKENNNVEVSLSSVFLFFCSDDNNHWNRGNKIHRQRTTNQKKNN